MIDNNSILIINHITNGKEYKKLRILNKNTIYTLDSYIFSSIEDSYVNFIPFDFDLIAEYSFRDD